MKRPKSKKKIQSELMSVIQNEMDKSEILQVTVDYSHTPIYFDGVLHDHIETGPRVLTIRYVPKVKK